MPILRIVHYNHTEVVAGAERVLLNLLPCLQELGFNSIVLSPDGPLQREAQQAGIERELCYALEARFTWNPLLFARYVRSLWLSVSSLRRQFKRLRPDVIHANSVRAGIVASVATSGLQIPIVWHVHDTLPLHPFSPVIRMLAAASRRTSLIAVSHATARTFAGSVFKACLQGKSDVLQNVMGHRSSRSTTEDRLRLRSQLGVGDRFLVGCVAQICARKNQIALVELFAKAIRQSPQMMLVIAGSALFPHAKSYETKLHQRVRELRIEDNVLLLGLRDDVPLLLETLDLLVLPSISEPFPMILLEAMAAELPTIAFAVDGVPELIKDGETGWLVAPGDQEHMARLLILAERNGDRRKEVGRAGRRSVEGNSQPDYARRFATILRTRCNVTQFQPNLPTPPGRKATAPLDTRLE